MTRQIAAGVFVAYGTRGDVQPLVCLACQLQHACNREEADVRLEAGKRVKALGRFSLVTHLAHKVMEGLGQLQCSPNAGKMGPARKMILSL
jgi:hypothetical protein